MPSPALPGLRCLVTGGSGFVGRMVVARLNAAGWHVETLGRSAARAPHAGTHHILDLAAAPPSPRALEGFDAVIHLVAALPGDPPARFHAVNVYAASRLAEAARSAGVRRFVHLSSTRAITANGARDRITDDDPPRPGDPYGHSKRDGEIAVLAAFPDAMILRPPLILGAGMRGSMARLVRLAKSGLPLPVNRLTAPRSFVAIADLADAIAHLLRAPDLAGEAMLVASAGTLSVLDIVTLIRAQLGMPKRCFALPLPLVARATRLIIGADAAAALTHPLRVEPRILPMSGFSPRADLAGTIQALAGEPMTGMAA